MKFLKKYLRLTRQYYLDELSFFKSFHTNRINWIIHAVTIPLEWTATLIILSIFGIHWYVAAVIGIHHFLIGARVSSAAAVAQFVFCYIAQHIRNYFGNTKAFLLALLVHICAWITQVCIGHWLFEKNSPAMATRLTINSVALSVLLAWDSYWGAGDGLLSGWNL